MFEGEELVVERVLKFLKFYRDNGLNLDQVIEVLEYDRATQLFPEKSVSNQS